jgi:hypothetical protein
MNNLVRSWVIFQALCPRGARETRYEPEAGYDHPRHF